MAAIVDIHSSIALALALASAEPAAPARVAPAASSTAVSASPAPTLPPPSGLRLRGGYLAVAPGILEALGRYYLCGIDGGFHLPAGRRFAVQLGGFFDYLVHRRKLGHATRTSTFQTFSLGVQARLGGGNQRVFGYGLIRLGTAFEFATRHYWYGTEREHAPLLLVTTGGGVQGLVTRRLMLGGEASADYHFFLGKPDPDNEHPLLPAFKVRLRLFIGVMF